MDYDKKIIHRCIELISLDLGVEKQQFELATAHEEPLKILQQQLTKVIQHLIDQDFSRLVNIMYRLDIKEDKFKEVMSFKAPEQIASALAGLIIQREIQKAITRAKYKGKA